MGNMKLVGQSEAHNQLLEELAVVAVTDAEVLITGPTGVGKELYARYVHEKSRRSKRPFVPVNCGAFPDSLLENELFGHANGAFTGAQGKAKGLIAEAEGGTLFFDEVDTLLPGHQVKLLRLLQEKEYRPLGDSRVRKANVRFIAATNADLEQNVRDRKFREDLFFRLRVASCRVPPLRERREDIPVLLAHYVEHYAEAYQSPPIAFSEAARRLLVSYSWPGNVRELENCVQRLTIFRLGRPIEPDDLDLLKWEEPIHNTDELLPFKEAKEKVVNGFERFYLEETLRRTNGNITQAADLGKKNRRAYFELMQKNNVDANRYRTQTKKKDA
jgi:DNA-binding NtrC family response regulator